MRNGDVIAVRGARFDDLTSKLGELLGEPIAPGRWWADEVLIETDEVDWFDQLVVEIIDFNDARTPHEKSRELFNHLSDGTSWRLELHNGTFEGLLASH